MIDIIAIDWGEKKCGLAFGSTEYNFIYPSKDTHLNSNIFEELKKIIEQKKIKKIILGYPTNFELKKTIISEKIDKFKFDIENNFHIKVDYVNERGTTKEFKKIDTNKVQIDNLSACKILEIYLNKKSTTK